MATVPVTVERYTAPENDADYIDMGTAVKMGFGSPNTLNRWVKQGCVRNFKEGQRRLLNVADLVQRARERDVIDVNVAYDDLLFRLTSFAPVFSDEQKQRLSALLSACGEAVIDMTDERRGALCITRRGLVRAGLGVAGLAACAGLVRTVSPIEAEAAIDVTLDDKVSVYVGGDAYFQGCAESEGVLVVAGNVNDAVAGVHSIAGRVIWGLDTPPSPETTTLVVGGDYSLTEFHSVFSGGNTRIGGTVNSSTASHRNGTIVGPDDRTGVSVPLARAPEEQWEFDPRWGYAGAKNTRVVAGLGRESALIAVTTDGEPIDYNDYWSRVIAPVVSVLRERASTGSTTFGVEPAYSGHMAIDPEVSGDPSVISSDFDGRMAFQGDRDSRVQVFDLDWAESERQLSALGRRQWSVSFDGIPEEAIIVVRVHGSNVTTRYGWRCYLNGDPCYTFVNSTTADPTFQAFRDLASRVLWLFDEGCGSVLVDSAHAWFDGTGGRVDIYKPVGEFHGDLTDRACPGGLSQDNLMPGSLIVPGSVRLNGSTNGKLLVRDRLDVDTWEHHNVVWRGLINGSVGSEGGDPA